MEGAPWQERWGSGWAPGVSRSGASQAQPRLPGSSASPAQHRQLGNAPGRARRGHREPWECRQPGLGQFKKRSTRNIKLTHFSSMSRGGCRQAAKPVREGNSRTEQRPGWSTARPGPCGHRCGQRAGADPSRAALALARPPVPGRSAPLPGLAAQERTSGCCHHRSRAQDSCAPPNAPRPSSYMRGLRAARIRLCPS